MRIGFGVNFMPTAPVLEVVEWAKAVERHGYALLGISDSQSISRDVYVTLAPRHRHQYRIRFGSRHHAGDPPSGGGGVGGSDLAELASSTMIGIGSGDSAAYTIGAKPRRSRAARYALAIRSLMITGQPSTTDGPPRSPVAVRAPIYLAASDLGR